MLLRILITFFIIMLILSSVYSRQKDANISEPIIIRNADSIVGVPGLGGHVRRYEGNVRFEQGRILLFCDIATQYFTENRAVLRGNVEIHQDDMIMKAPIVIYYGGSGIAKASEGVEIIDWQTIIIADKGTYSTKTLIADFIDNVIVEDDSVKIYADRIIHYRDTKNSRAYGNVLIKGKHTNAALRGDTVIYIPKDHYTIASGSPTLHQVDTSKAYEKERSDGDSTLYEGYYSDMRADSIRFDTLSISSDTMEAFRGPYKENYFFSGNVEITRGGVAATADSAVYDKRKNYITLYGLPIVWYDSTQLYADSTVIYYRGNKLRSIRAFGNALAASRDDVFDLRRINQIEGNEIAISFIDGAINGIAGYGGSKSLYFMSDEESADGVDQKAADSVLINFVDGRPDNIIWLGGVDAKYFPEKLVSGDPSIFFLPSFRWTDVRPKKKNIGSRKETVE